MSLQVNLVLLLLNSKSLKMTGRTHLEVLLLLLLSLKKKHGHEQKNSSLSQLRLKFSGHKHQLSMKMMLLATMSATSILTLFSRQLEFRNRYFLPQNFSQDMVGEKFTRSAKITHSRQLQLALKYARIS